MLDQTNDALIELLGQARLDGQKVPLGTPPLNGSGYNAQQQLAEWLVSRGQGTHSGYKIGATTKVMQALLGVPGPIFGHVLSANVFNSGTSFKCNPACNPGIECEIVFRLGTNLPVAGAPYTREEVVDCIEAIIPAIEIVENRYGDYRIRDIALLTADDFFHKACVLGTPINDWRDINLLSCCGQVIVNGEAVETGYGREVLGDPLEAVVWLANTLAERGAGLSVGQIVSTGSMTQVHWIKNLPQMIEICIEGLGLCAVELKLQ